MKIIYHTTFWPERLNELNHYNKRLRATAKRARKGGTEREREGERETDWLINWLIDWLEIIRSLLPVAEDTASLRGYINKVCEKYRPWLFWFPVLAFLWISSVGSNRAGALLQFPLVSSWDAEQGVGEWGVDLEGSTGIPRILAHLLISGFLTTQM